MHTRLDSPDFVHLPENRSAYAAVMDLAHAVTRGEVRESPCVFLHGPSGSGKSRLARAAQNEIERRGHGLTITRLFASELTLPDGPQLLAAAEGADLLIVEDLHHLAFNLVESLIQLLDARDADRRCSLVTACFGPGKLSRRGVAFPARLRSRLAAGLVVALEPLSAGGRLAAIEELARRRQLTVSREVLACLAENLGTWRQLEGALTQLQSLTPAEVTAQFANSRPTVQHIAEHVGEHFNVHARQLRSPRRARSVLLPRQISMYLARRLTNLSLEEIGDYFGGRDHSTVLHACSKVETALNTDLEMDGALRQLEAELGRVQTSFVD